ncbi:MAG: methyltransferase domain-containing protein [Thermoplasmata archaeon]
MSSKEKVASRYDVWSPFYDAVDNFPLISRPQKCWRSRSIDMLNLQGGELVLDVGTGSGYILPEIVDRLEDGHVVGTDISKGMLRRAKKRAVRENVDHKVSIVKDDIEDSKFPADHFDRIITTFTFTTVPDPTKAIKECKRILKEDGYMVILDTGRPKGNFSRYFFYPMMLSAKIFGRTHMDRDIYRRIQDHFQVMRKEYYMYGMVYLYGCEKK